MTRLSRKRQALYDDSPVRVYGAMPIAMLPYPYRLGRVDENSPTAAKNAEHYILDSGIGDDSVTTTDIIESANYLEADVVVPKDVIGDPHATADAVRELYDRRDELHDGVETIILPLQINDTYSYSDVMAMMPPINDFECWYGVGGMKDSAAVVQIERTIRCREAIGLDEHLHAFGCGASMPWVRTIVRCPWLLDSLDLSTPAQLSSRGMMLHGDCDKLDVTLPRGKKCTSLNTQLAQFSVMLLNWYYSGQADSRDLDYEISDPKLETLCHQHELWYGHNKTDELTTRNTAVSRPQ